MLWRGRGEKVVRNETRKKSRNPGTKSRYREVDVEKKVEVIIREKLSTRRPNTDF